MFSPELPAFRMVLPIWNSAVPSLSIPPPLPVAELSLTVLLLIVSRTRLGTSAALETAPPLPVAELPLRVLLLTITEARAATVPAAPFIMPPPSLAVAELSLMVLLVMVNVAGAPDAEFPMPPPLKAATLPLIVQLFTISAPFKLKMPPPRAAEFPLTVQSLSLSVAEFPPSLKTPAPLLPGALPFVILKPEMVAPDVKLSNTRKVPLPSTDRLSAPGPLTVTAVVICNSPLVSKMVPEMPVASMMSPLTAVASASRNEPGPLSLVFVTTMILPGNAWSLSLILCSNCRACPPFVLVVFRCASARGITHTATPSRRT